MKRKTNYGNWVPKNMLRVSYGLTLVLVVAVIVVQVIGSMEILAAILGGIGALLLVFSIYMHICRNTFAFEKGGLMGRIHEYLLGHLAWDGKGKLLDIGCGAGALTIQSAKKYPEAKLTGIDYWGREWNYAKEQCEENAVIEGVADRIHFQKGDAAKLDFANEMFDAAVSNFVFHEVKSAKDKRDVVREALRVVKKGGVFAFQDMFSQKGLYGDMEEFVRELKREGIKEIHYIASVEKKEEFIPSYITAPWMLYGMGLIYGVK